MRASLSEVLAVLNIIKILVDGAILSLIASLYLFIVLYLNPRLFLQDYPEDIQKAVPPKTKEEKRLSLMVGIPFLVLLFAVPFLSTLALKGQSGGNVTFLVASLHAFGVVFIFNLVDWLLLDWVVFCAITPRFVVIPGTEGMGGYKNYFYHFRAFLIGTVFSIVAGLIIGAIVFVL